jgi:prophage regulatory protein
MADQFLRIHEVMSRSGLARSTLYLRISQNKFPRSVPLASPYTVGWLESEVDAWIRAQVLAARHQTTRLSSTPKEPTAHKAPAK